MLTYCSHDLTVELIIILALVLIRSNTYSLLQYETSLQNKNC